MLLMPNEVLLNTDIGIQMGGECRLPMLYYSECMHRPIQTYQLQEGAYGDCIFAEHMKSRTSIH